jgi:hypothetical protein
MISTLLFTFMACNPDPGEISETVGYRVGDDESSGERGTVQITEVLWSGSVNNDGIRDPDDNFIELRNTGDGPVNLSGWQLQISGEVNRTLIIPTSDVTLDVGEHGFVAAKDTGCFPNATWVVSELDFGKGDAFQVTIRDQDERLIEPVGSTSMPPFAGGYDLVTSRSMERIELMFGGAGTAPSSWHFYTPTEVDVPNDTNVSETCRNLTHASPGLANSPDYSGSYATGSFE